MNARTCLALLLLAGCSGATRDGDPDLAQPIGATTDLAGADLAKGAEGPADFAIMAGEKKLVLNEVNPAGSDPLTDPDWVELKNVSAAAVNLKDYTLADSKTEVALPDAMVSPGGWVIVLCDDAPDMGGLGGIHAPFKLKQKGDEVHLRIGGAEADNTTWGMTDVPDGKTWGRNPDGTGAFATTSPTKLAANMP